MNDIENKIQKFATLLETQQIERLKAQKLDCQDNLDNSKVKVKPGKKFTKVDVGTSGKYMIENETGNIFGIKAYGQVHRGHFYGTVETTDVYDWSDYYPRKLDGNNPTTRFGIPALTHAPEPVKAEGTTELVNGVPTIVPEGHHVVKNILSGRDVVESKDTPFCCSVSSEQYHSM